MSDPELDAMTAIHQALGDLDVDARARVISWASSKFDVASPVAIVGRPGQGPPSGGAGRDVPAFADISDLIHAAEPNGGSEQALVVGYWLQRMDGQEGWSGAQVNAELKHLGYAQANITSTLSRLMKRKPSLVVQVAKSGRAQQARKTYKLTVAGIRAVEQMIGHHEEA